MPRSRNIKPQFFKDDQLHHHGPLAALLFAGLWTIADKAGRLKDRPAWIKAECLPYYDCDVAELLSHLANGADPYIYRYAVDGVSYIQIRSWEEHQSPHHKEADSKIPTMEHASNIRDQVSGINNQESGIRAASTQLGCSRSEQPTDKQASSKAHASIKKQSNEFDPFSVGLPFKSSEFREAWGDWVRHRIEKEDPLLPTSVKHLLRQLDRWGETRSITAIRHTIGNNWKGLREPDNAHAAGSEAEEAAKREEAKRARAKRSRAIAARKAKREASNG